MVDVYDVSNTSGQNYFQLVSFQWRRTKNWKNLYPSKLHLCQNLFGASSEQTWSFEKNLRNYLKKLHLIAQYSRVMSTTLHVLHQAVLLRHHILLCLTMGHQGSYAQYSKLEVRRKKGWNENVIECTRCRLVLFKFSVQNQLSMTLE